MPVVVVIIIDKNNVARALARNLQQDLAAEVSTTARVRRARMGAT